MRRRVQISQVFSNNLRPGDLYVSMFFVRLLAAGTSTRQISSA